MADGSRKAIPYSYIMEINFQQDNGIEIISSSTLVKIIGRDLEKLYDYLIAYRVRYVQMHTGTDANENGLFIKSIDIEDIS